MRRPSLPLLCSSYLRRHRSPVTGAARPARPIIQVNHVHRCETVNRILQEGRNAVGAGDSRSSALFAALEAVPEQERRFSPGALCIGCAGSVAGETVSVPRSMCLTAENVLDGASHRCSARRSTWSVVSHGSGATRLEDTAPRRNSEGSSELSPSRKWACALLGTEIVFAKKVLIQARPR